MEAFIVEGEIATIKDFPHSAFLGISCENLPHKSHICGSSIINQLFVLTAAHCLADCSNSDYISVVVGQEHRLKGVKSSAYKFKIHESYDDMTMEADIALVLLQTSITFDSKVQRVILMKNPPYSENAFVAGWGLVDEIQRIKSMQLRFARQKVWCRTKCTKIISKIPNTAFCAARENGYASAGDSGSALVTNYDHSDMKFVVQIGLVSYKDPDLSTIIVYTNVSYYVDWITDTTRKMHCR